MDEIKEIRKKIKEITKYPFSKEPCDHYCNNIKMIDLEGKGYAVCDECKKCWRNKEYDVVVSISREYVQIAAESNHDTRLTDKEFEDFEVILWEDEENRIYEAVCDAIDEIFDLRKDVNN